MFGRNSIFNGELVDHIFTDTNTGTAAVSLSGLVVSFIGGTRTTRFFSILDGLSATLAAGASNTFTVRFDPAEVGRWTREVRFVVNGVTASPYRFAVRGTVAV